MVSKLQGSTTGSTWPAIWFRRLILIQTTQPFTRSEMAAEPGTSGDALMECRICAMEATENELCVPCGCTGSLTYAHPRCVQQWVSRKNLGDTRERGICEICGEAWRIEINVPAPATEADLMRAQLEWVTRILGCAFFRVTTGFPRENDENILRTLGPYLSGPWDSLVTKLNRPTLAKRFQAWVATMKERAAARRETRKARSGEAESSAAPA